MSCPYFFPIERRRAEPAMLPLGGLWSGECRAIPHAPCRPEEAALRPLCNLGYARGACPRFPANADSPDAVRFIIARDAGETLALYYAIEHDHHPFAHGPLAYSVAGGTVADAATEILARQACAYAESYLARKHEAQIEPAASTK